MKLMTLNAHSKTGERARADAECLASVLLAEGIDVLALQEVNQTERGRASLRQAPWGFVPCDGYAFLGQDNFAALLAELVNQKERRYHWTWLAVKRGYGKYDEGLAFFSRRPIRLLRTERISRTDDYGDWRRRAAILMQREGEKTWFCNTHMGWWEDAQDPFEEQWQRLREILTAKTPSIVMGDLNNPPELSGEGYERMLRDGFVDTYTLARERYGEGKVEVTIDGWRGKSLPSKELRLDLILSDRPVEVRRYQSFFDGQSQPRISDHPAVMVELCAKGVGA